MKQVGAVRGGEGVVVSKMLEAKCTCQCWDSGANGKQAALLKGHRREARQPMRTARRSVRACASRTAHRLALRQQRAASSVEHAQHAHYSRSADGADGLAAILARGRCVLQGCSSALAAHRAVPAWDLCMWQKNRWEGCRGLIGKRAQVHGGRGGAWTQVVAILEKHLTGRTMSKRLQCILRHSPQPPLFRAAPMAHRSHLARCIHADAAQVAGAILISSLAGCVARAAGAEVGCRREVTRAGG